jgi:hypothetical protein
LSIIRIKCSLREQKVINTTVRFDVLLNPCVPNYQGLVVGPSRPAAPGDNNRYRDFGFLVLLHVVTRYSEQFLWQFARKIFLKERVRSRPVSLDGLQNKAVDVPECEGDRTLLICGARLVFRPLVLLPTSKQIRRSLSPHGNLRQMRRDVCATPRQLLLTGLPQSKSA